MKNFYNKYLNDEIKVDNSTFISLLCALTVVGGIYGAIYETLFYLLNNNALCKRGSCFGPWIEIYGIGSLLIYFLCHRHKRSPLKVFLIAGLSCGLLEYLAGKGMYIIFDGRRGWNYNTEILNFGNVSKKIFNTVCITLAFLFLMDVVYNDIIVSIFHTYSSLDFYKNIDIFKYYNESRIN